MQSTGLWCFLKKWPAYWIHFTCNVRYKEWFCHTFKHNIFLLKICQNQQQQLNLRSKIRCTVCQCKKNNKQKYRDSSNLDIHNEIFSTSANRSRVKAVTALPPSRTSPGLTGHWKARNSKTTDYHTAPSLASRCRLMGSWKVKMKKWYSLHAFLSPLFSLHHSAVSDRCHSFCLSGSRFPSSPPRRHKWECTERGEWKSQEEIEQRNRSHENNKNGQVISVKLL